MACRKVTESVNHYEIPRVLGLRGAIDMRKERNMGMSIADMARAGEAKRKVLCIRGSLSTIFTEALQLALGKDSTPTEHDRIAHVVAMETSAQEAQFMNELAEKAASGYKLTKDEIEITPENKIVVDVIDGDSPDEVAMMDVVRTMDTFDKLKDDEAAENPSNYIVVVAQDPSKAVDGGRRQDLLTSMVNMAERRGYRVEHMAVRYVQSD